MIQFFCDVTGIDPRIVRVNIDTTEPTPCGMTTASRATVLGGRAMIDAAEKMNDEELYDWALDKLFFFQKRC